MPSALLDAPRADPARSRPTVAAPPAPGRPSAAPVARPEARRRLPVPVGMAALVAVLESLGLLALGLSSLDGVFGTGIRPNGTLVAVTLLLLAGWVVLCAGGGASLVDGAGRTLITAVAAGEICLLLVVVVAGVLGADGVWLVVLGPLGALPVPALALLALGVPTLKLLLAGAPSATAWVEAGGRPRTTRPATAVRYRGLRSATLVCIGLALTGIALLGGPAGSPATSGTAAVVDAP